MEVFTSKGALASDFSACGVLPRTPHHSECHAIDQNECNTSRSSSDREGSGTDAPNTVGDEDSDSNDKCECFFPTILQEKVTSNHLISARAKTGCFVRGSTITKTRSSGRRPNVLDFVGVQSLTRLFHSTIENLSGVDNKAFLDSIHPQSPSTDEEVEVPMSPAQGMRAPVKAIQIRLVGREMNISVVQQRMGITVRPWNWGSPASAVYW